MSAFRLKDIQSSVVHSNAVSLSVEIEPVDMLMADSRQAIACGEKSVAKNG